MQALPAIVASTVQGLTSTPTHAERLRRVAAPTLVVHGTGDLAIAFDGGRALAELIAGAALLALEGMGHFPQDVTRWAAIADAVVDHVHGAARR
jgi:pimeloyl-ACP methyl ester carboxylesterase